GNGVLESVAACAALSGRTGDDVNLVTTAGDRAKVVLQCGPRTLVVVRRLGHHVRHEERGLVDGDGRLLIPVRVRGHVSSVEARAGEVAAEHAVPIRKDRGI